MKDNEHVFQRFVEQYCGRRGTQGEEVVLVTEEDIQCE